MIHPEIVIYPESSTLNVQVGEDVCVFIDGGVMDIDAKRRKYNVAFMVFEPVEIIGNGAQIFLLENWQKFDLILTDQTPLLSLPNAKLFLFASPWLYNNEGIAYPNRFGVSTVVGRKAYAPGHVMRHQLWDRRAEIVSIPKFFYVSGYGGPTDGNLMLGPSKVPLFETQFHIAIENSQSDYYLSEKVADCFRTKCVPIYFGARKISDFFDERGMFIANNVDEIVQICNNIKPDTYNSMLPYIEENYNRAYQYMDIGSRITDAIKTNINIV